jgi:hypothetical protein
MLRVAAQALVILIGGAFLLVWVNNIPSPQPNHYQRPKETYTEYCGNDAPETWGKRFRCDPVADFTALLALFTAVLGAVAIIQMRYLISADRNARIAAEAASLHAQSAVAVELPMVFLNNLTLLETGPYGHTDIFPVNTNPPAMSCWPRIEFVNYGRSPAQVVSISWNYHVSIELPEGLTTNIDEWQPIGTIIKPHGEVFAIDDTTRIILSPEERTFIIKDKARLWIFGAIFFRDFMGTTLHHRKFCGVWWCPEQQPSLTPCGFGQGGPESYQGSS